MPYFILDIFSILMINGDSKLQREFLLFLKLIKRILRSFTLYKSLSFRRKWLSRLFKDVAVLYFSFAKIWEY
ncbi:hypothetical protein FDG09_02330 [Clostridium sporogenes]|nr:hypothetical protein [Clostridium sporogenes]